MFEVKIFVDDKKLSQVMWALDNMIVGEPTIRPVRTASAPVACNGSALPHRVAEIIAMGRIKDLTPELLRQLTIKAGGKKNSYSYVKKQLQKLKVLGPLNKKSGNYLVK